MSEIYIVFVYTDLCICMYKYIPVCVHAYTHIHVLVACNFMNYIGLKTLKLRAFS